MGSVSYFIPISWTNITTALGDVVTFVNQNLQGVLTAFGSSAN